MNTISHFGLFWSKENVCWSPGQGGEIRLRGQVDGKGQVRNFRDYVGVYCLYDGERLLYVGQSGVGGRGGGQALFQRIKQHILNPKDPVAGRWDSFSWFGRKKSKGVPGLTLLQLEAVMIAVTNPPFNRKQGSFGAENFPRAKQVFQVPDEEAKGKLVKQIGDDLINRLEKMGVIKPKSA